MVSSQLGPYYAVILSFCSSIPFVQYVHNGRWLPYLTLQSGEDILPPSAEASNRPNAHPQTIFLTQVTQGYKIPKCRIHLGSHQ